MPAFGTYYLLEKDDQELQLVPRRVRRWKVSSSRTIGIGFLLFVLSLCAFHKVQRSITAAVASPAESCRLCYLEVPKEQLEWPVVGYDLTESYGTATIKFPTGEIINIGPLEADQAYKNAMRKLSLKSSRHTAPPYEWFHDPPNGPFAGTYDTPRRQLRALRKKIGLAATAEVGAVSTLLKSLSKEAKRIVQDRNPNHDATKAVITPIDLVALYDEDIYDIAEYAGLDASSTSPFLTAPFPKSLLSCLRYQRQPKYVDATFIGYSLGHPESRTALMGEEVTLKNVISVYLSRRAVSVECPPGGKLVAGTTMLNWQQHDSFLDDKLGMDQHGTTGYWDNVRGLVTECMAKSFLYRNVTDVLLVGESIGDERVMVEVTRAVMEKPQQMFQPNFHLDAEPIFIASCRAAEMADRVLRMPYGCGFDEPAEGQRKCRS